MAPTSSEKMKQFYNPAFQRIYNLVIYYFDQRILFSI